MKEDHQRGRDGSVQKIRGLVDIFHIVFSEGFLVNLRCVEKHDRQDMISYTPMERQDADKCDLVLSSYAPGV